MGRMKELFMHMRELEMQNEDTDHVDDDYLYEQYIQEKYKSPRYVGFMVDNQGDQVMLQGNTEQEVLSIAKRHNLEGEFTIMNPTKHLF